jgi:hypothetical protein
MIPVAEATSSQAMVGSGNCFDDATNDDHRRQSSPKLKNRSAKAGNQCGPHHFAPLWQFTISDGAQFEDMLVLAGSSSSTHSFKAKIGKEFATVTVDGKEFQVPRENTL